jgi:hypothetical protein
MPKIKLLFVYITVLWGLKSYAQQSDFGNWLIYFGDIKLKNKWNFHNEVQYRNFNYLGDTEQLLIRFGLGYQIKEKWNFLMGYGYIYNEPYLNDGITKTNSVEHRVFQQNINKINYKRLYTTHRLRLEERFLTNDFSIRFRYFLLLNVPLTKSKMENNTFYYSMYNEIFLFSAKNEVFDRNRLYAGLGYKQNNHFRYEIGAMNQMVGTNSRNQLNLIVYCNF